jgi:hypothetical protein
MSASELASARRWAGARVNTGIARGWWGWAWVWLHAVRAGLAPDDPRTRRTIAQRLTRGGDPAMPIGSMVGSAAAPVVAALLASIDPAAVPLRAREIARWAAACGRDSDPDLLHGAAGALLAAAEIEALAPGAVPQPLAARLHAAVTRSLRAHLGPRGRLTIYLGLAHGIAGFLLALEAARAVLGLPLPRRLRVRAIDYLMQERVRGPGNIAGWPVAPSEVPILANAWCSGTAGVALAALCGQHASGDRAYGELVDCALPSTFALRGGRFQHFCCGTTGQAQILLEAHRLLGDRRWLDRARRTAALVGRPRGRNRSFTWGALGARHLELRLAHPGRLPLPGLGCLSAPV